MPYSHVLALLGLKLSCCFCSEKFVHNGGGWPYRSLKYGSTQGIILLYMLLISTKLQLDTWYFISIVARQAVKKLSLSHGQHCSYIFSGISLASASELVVLCHISDNISNVPPHGQVIKNLLLLTHLRAKTYKKQLQTQKHLRWSKKIYFCLILQGGSFSASVPPYRTLEHWMVVLAQSTIGFSWGQEAGHTDLVKN